MSDRVKKTSDDDEFLEANRVGESLDKEEVSRLVIVMHKWFSSQFQLQKHPKVFARE